MANERPDAPLQRLCQRTADRLRRDCLISFALDMRGHRAGPLRRMWELAKTDGERRAVADAIAHVVNSTLELATVFIDFEVMHKRLQIVVEPTADVPYKVVGDDWLRLVLGPMLFDPDHEYGKTSAGEQLYDLITVEPPVFGRPDEPTSD